MAKETESPAVSAEVVACLEKLDAAGTAQGKVLREERACGGFIEYWLEDGKVLRREVDAEAKDGTALVSALQGRVASEFGGLSGKLLTEACGAVPDLDSIETALRDGVHGVGSAGLKAILEEVDRRLPVPSCGKCGARMEVLSYHEKRYTTRLGKVTVRRKRVHCRSCGSGYYPLDRHLGIEGESVTPGAASVIADIVKDDSYGASSRKLLNTAGIDLGATPSTVG